MEHADGHGEVLVQVNNDVQRAVKGGRADTHATTTRRLMRAVGDRSQPAYRLEP